MSKKRISIKPKSELRNVQQKLDDWVFNKAEETDNLANPPPTNVDKLPIEDFRFTFFMPTRLHKRIKKFCVDNDISMKDKIVELLEREFSGTQ